MDPPDERSDDFFKIRWPSDPYAVPVFKLPSKRLNDGLVLFQLPELHGPSSILIEKERYREEGRTATRSRG